MSRLVIQRGFSKLAAAEDGPSLEQQFGTLANALIVEEYPKLDRHRLAFQLIDKAEDNSTAVGACVYLLGSSVIFVPAFYKSGKIKTGDMMFLAKEQQFLPLSDPWLSWVMEKNLQQPGDIVPDELVSGNEAGDAQTVREITDPIIKTASVYLKGIIRTAFDVTKSDNDGFSVFDTALGMGKHASEALLDNLIGDTNFLNASLRFYSADYLDGFAKKAAELGEEKEAVTVIYPFTKEAKDLTPEETEKLKKDGYLIKVAESKEEPTVIKYNNVHGRFSVIDRPGEYELPQMDGTLTKCLVMRNLPCDVSHCSDITERTANKWDYDRSLRESAPVFMRHHEFNGCCYIALEKGNSTKMDKLSADVVKLRSGTDVGFKPEMLEGYGEDLNSPGTLEYDSYILCPNGNAYRINGTYEKIENGWKPEYAYTDDDLILIGKSDDQVAPFIAGKSFIIPNKSKIWRRKPPKVTSNGSTATSNEPPDQSLKNAYVTVGGLPAFINQYTEKNYKRVKVTSNGYDVRIDGYKSNGEPLSVKDASLHLVREYGVDPDIAKQMLVEAYADTAAGGAGSETYLLSKTAYDDPYWEDATTGKNMFVNRGEQDTLMRMPEVVDDPAKLQQAVMSAAEQGVKEVFDVTAFKLLVRQNRFLEEIHDDLPLLMRTLDSLCRKLFLLYCHTEDFEKQYGTVKLKSLEDSLKNTLDSLSDITVFFKLRTVSGDGGFGQDGGDLMQGHDI